MSASLLVAPVVAAGDGFDWGAVLPLVGVILGAAATGWVSALVLAARRSPPETVAAVLGTHWDREKEAAAVVVVCGFLRAYGPRGTS
jgi:hypothetical protein